MKSLIGTEWRDAKDGKVIEVRNPATNELIDTVPSLSAEEVNEAVDSAFEAQKKWEKVPVHKRCSIMMKFVELVERDKESLAKTLSDETGKPIKEARTEIANISIGVPAYVERVKHDYGNVIPRGTEKGQENTIQYTIQQPLGVCAAIIPFNFPSDIFINKIPPALLMGNSVIMKPSPHNPLTLTKYAELLLEAGVDEGVINVINGTGGAAAQALAANPGVALVSLTGATKSGMETMKTCSSNLTHVMLELGGNDAFILDRDGDVDLAVEETVWGRFYNTGQVCCASKRFLIHNSVKKEYIKKLKERLSKIKRGMPSDPTVELGCLVSEQAAIRVEEQVNQTVAEGATIVMGGKRDGAFYDPTILDGVTKNMAVAKDLEIFGPVVSIIGFDDINEAIKIAKKNKVNIIHRYNYSNKSIGGLSK